ncbi:ribonuclease H-like domain-containing protein [Tanacetum coccineum]
MLTECGDGVASITRRRRDLSSDGVKDLTAASELDHIQADAATRDASRLHFFHFTLKGKAKEWLDKIPPGMITSWEQIISKFLDKFFPPERTARIRDKILWFHQSNNESIKDAWKCFQAHQQLSFLTSSTPGKTLKNPYLICDIYGRAYEADECDQVESREQACLSGKDIYDDPSLLKFYQNNDIAPWGNLIRKREEEDPDWVVRSKFEDEMGNFMMEKKYHLKGLREMLRQQRNDMHEQFSQILSTLDDKTTNKEPTLAITTRSGTTTRDPPYPNQLNSTPIVTNEAVVKEGIPTEKENPNTPNLETPLSSTLHHPSKSSNIPFPSRL